MQQDLLEFTTSGTKICDELVTWGTMPLQVTCYLGNKPPPVRYVSSVRAIVFRSQSVLVVTQKNGEIYIVPGGRVEKGEMPLETLTRELLEETGWTILRTELLGFMQFHHLAAKPVDYRYPYPDFLWPIYLAEAKDFMASAIIPDDYVSESAFRPIEEVRRLTLPNGQLLLFEAALRRR